VSDLNDTTAGTNCTAIDYALMLSAHHERARDLARVTKFLDDALGQAVAEPLEDDADDADDAAELAPTMPPVECPRPVVRRPRPTGVIR
jgi:hypothetical protein